MAETLPKGVIRVDFTGVEAGGGFVRVPEGDYGMEITKVQQKTGEDSGKAYLNISLKLSQGDKKGNGKTLVHRASLSQKALWNLKNMLEACGKQVPSKALKITLSNLIGLKCAGTVIDDEPYEGKIKSIVSAFFPLADLGKTSEGDELEEAGEEPEEVAEPKAGKKKTKKPAEEVEEEATEEAEEEELFS